MIQATTIKFLKDLEKNNDKSWFDDNRSRYEVAREAFLQSVEAMIKAIALFEPAIGEQTAKQSVFRINRDVRFSKDKRPYKNNMSAYFNAAGKKSNLAGYYVHIEPGKSFVAAGVWMPEAAALSKIRQEIDYNFEEWNGITTATAFKKLFPTGINTEDSLQRPPKGYDENNPAIKILKLKSFIGSRSFTDAEVMHKDFTKELSKTFKALMPMVHFINRSLD
jgi:uncharacterized protein (TIGR02453 family)